MLTPEQIIERRSFVGASDAPAILGVSPYASAWDVYAEKTGVTIDRSAMEQRFWFGSEIEHVVARRYEVETGHEVLTAPARIHPQHAWLRASPDRLVPAIEGGLEIKTVSTYEERMWGVEGTDEVPPHVRIQCDVLMACHDVQRWDVMALFGSFTSRRYTLSRIDAKHEAQLIAALERWWFGHVVPRIDPPMDGSEGARTWLREMYPRDESEVRPAESVEELEAIEDFIAAKRAELAAAARIAAAKNELARCIGAAGGLECSHGRITYRANKHGVRSFRTKLEGISDE